MTTVFAAGIAAGLSSCLLLLLLWWLNFWNNDL